MPVIKLFWNTLLLLSMGIAIYQLLPYLLWMLMLISVGGLLSYLWVQTVSQMYRFGYGWVVCGVVPLLVVISGVGLHFAYLGQPLLLPLGGLPLMGMIIYPRVQQRRLIAHYQRNLPQMIQP